MGIVVVDHGAGNVGSIANMLRKVGASAEVSSDPDRVAASTVDALILPGVGSFDVAMKNLRALDLIEPLERQVLGRGVPVLGICLGLQLFASSSDEGVDRGLGWIPGRVTRLAAETSEGTVRIPHMGWNTVAVAGSSARLPSLGSEGTRYYFVHSYAIRCDDPTHAVGTTEYGEPFTSAVERENIVGVQFHPEKSHRHGMALMADFAGV